jgi:hypothetical protein
MRRHSAEQARKPASRGEPSNVLRPDSLRQLSGAERGSGGGGGRGGGFANGKGNGGAIGGSGVELEREARDMIRKGEMNPFELPTLVTANADDYAVTVIHLLGTMRPDDPKRSDSLLRIRQWIDKALAGMERTG